MKIDDKVAGSVQDAGTPLRQGYGGVYRFAKEGTATVNVLGFAAKSAEIA